VTNELTTVMYLFREGGWRQLWFSEHRRERLVTLGWSEIIGRYNTPDTMV